MKQETKRKEFPQKSNSNFDCRRTSDELVMSAVTTWMPAVCGQHLRYTSVTFL